MNTSKIRKRIRYNLSIALGSCNNRVMYISGNYKENEEDLGLFQFKFSFMIFKDSITMLKILNYIDNETYITSDNDIIILNMIYLEIFEQMERVRSKIGIPSFFINRWLKRKIGIKEYKKIIKRF